MNSNILQEIKIIVLILLISKFSVVECKEVDFTIYHTSEQLDYEMENLKGNCNNFLQIETIGTSPALKLAQLSKNVENSKQAFLVFGEHPRELISSETGLKLLQRFCENKQKETQDVLNNFEVQMILNSNPKSRKQVENGQLCLRENENGIDINRNYDAHWEHNVNEDQQTTSGDSAESEPETQAISNAMRDFKPDMFLSIHSGTLGLYTPHAYDTNQAEENEKDMLGILSEIGLDNCSECSVGAAGKQVGYTCSGTSLDFAYDTLEVPYSYVFEIYEQGVDLRRKKIALIQEQSKQGLTEQNLDNNNKQFLGKSDVQKTKLNSNPSQSCMAQTSSMTTNENQQESDYNQCFQFFNPEGKEEYDFNVNNWSTAILSLIQKTGDDINKKRNRKLNK